MNDGCSFCGGELSNSWGFHFTEPEEVSVCHACLLRALKFAYHESLQQGYTLRQRVLPQITYKVPRFDEDFRKVELK